MPNQVTVSDFAKVGWQDALDACERKECSYYYARLYSQARSAAESKDEIGHRVLTLLADITSLQFKLDSREEPLGPVMVLRDRRSPIVTDFSDEELDLLETVVPNITDPELQARIADVLWLRRHNYRLAVLAIDAYLNSATVLENPDEWPPFAERVERAVQLAASLGQKNPSFSKVISFIETSLDRYQGSDPLFLSARLMELLLDRRVGTPTKYIPWATKAAERAEKEHDWHRARCYWGINARWAALEGNREVEKAARVQEALAYVGECDDALDQEPPSYLAACSFLQQGIEACRRLGETSRATALHRRLLELQPKQMENMERISVTVDIGSELEQARARVQGKSLHDALFGLALSIRLPRIAQLRESAEKHSQQYIFPQLVSPTMLNDEGKVIARKPALLGGDSQQIEESIQAQMYEEARQHQQLNAWIQVESARQQINLEHNARESDLLPLVINNPFVPLGREPLFAKGLYTGLVGDFAIAAHLLVPQIENSIRAVLSRHGAITSGLSTDGIQEEFDLARLLSMPEAIEVFGEDRVFDLRGLLVERHGSNLRNRLAHGLVSFDELMSLDVSYLWWMTLNLCCLPILAQIHEHQAEDSTPPSSQNESASA